MKCLTSEAVFSRCAPGVGPGARSAYGAILGFFCASVNIRLADELWIANHYLFQIRLQP